VTRQTIAAAVSTLVTVAVLGGAIFVSLPSTVLYPRDGTPLREVLVNALPESWPFFTKPPSDSEITAYIVDEDRIRNASAFPNAKAANWFGIQRTQRAQGPEMANLINTLPQESWLQCREHRSTDCVVAAAETEPTAIRSEYTEQTLCGRVIIVETKPVAFSYTDMYTGHRLDEQALHLDVEC
jgi:antimicrobial peptide system SdpA family protein